MKPAAAQDFMQLRKASDRGYFDHGWLKTWHSFSFGGYYDPQHMGFRSLRVINEDEIAGGTGFPEHPHRNMEILTYVISGAIEHTDSAGNRSIIGAGEVQRMSAGSLIVHSEANASATEPLHLLQIWIQPHTNGLQPGYEQKSFEVAANPGQWQLIASPDGREGSLTIHQHAFMRAVRLKPGQSAPLSIEEGRAAWVQVVKGSVSIDGQALGGTNGIAPDAENQVDLGAGDGVGIWKNQTHELQAGESGAELIWFDLP